MEKNKLTKWLNELIGSEINASLQYELASHIVEGTDYDTCKSEFKKHADEERTHMNKLLTAAIEREIEIVTDIPTIIKNANPKYDEMKGTKSDILVQFHFGEEENAIKTYKEFYNLIEKSDVTLARTIKEILDDEVEHRTDLKKIYSSIKDGSKPKSKFSSFNY